MRPLLQLGLRLWDHNMRRQQQGIARRVVAFCLACLLWPATASLAAPLATASAPQASQAPGDAELRFQALNKQLADGLQEVQSQRQKVAEELKAAQKDLLDAQRKSIDWWFAALAVLTTIVAALGALLPYLMGRKDKELLQSELQNARDLVTSIRGHERQAAQVSEQLAKYQSGAPTDAAERTAVKQEAQTVKDDPAASAVEKLRARAVLASQVDSPTTDQAEAAYELWLALSVVDASNASAHFNAGYWAQDLFERSRADARSVWFSRLARHYASALTQNPASHDAAFNWGLALENHAQAMAPTELVEARRLWTQAGEKYAQALAIKPDKHDAAHNWGVALNDEAQLMAPSDLAGARRLWALATENYAKALAIKADKHETAYNWGIALNEEAQAVAPSDLAEGRRLWALAGEKYAQALAIKADVYEAANNWGIAFSREAQAVASSDLAEGRRLWALAAEKYAQALAIKADKYEAANNWGVSLSREAQVVAPRDLAEARRLWALAAEKYAQVLSIKADEHEAANYWGTVLLLEGSAVAPTEPATARDLWLQACEILERHVAAHPDGRSVIAYNLACAYALCGDAARAVDQLTLSYEAKLLPAYWREDKDLDPIRRTPEFQAWVQKTFPS